MPKVVNLPPMRVLTPVELLNFTEEICRFLKAGTSGLDNISGIPVRNYRLFVTLKMPAPGDDKSAVNERDIYSHFTEVLNGAELHPAPLPVQGLIDWMVRLFNDREFPGCPSVPYDGSRPISGQVLLSETVTEQKWEHLKMGSRCFLCVTPKAFPKPRTGVYPMQTNRLFGGVMGVVDDQNQIKTPYLYTLNIVFHDLRNRLRVKSSFDPSTIRFIMQRGRSFFSRRRLIAFQLPTSRSGYAAIHAGMFPSRN